MTLVVDYLLPFLVVLSVLVFVHEMGHYWVARRCGVRVDVFSIGFGPELFGWTDRPGTRWKVCAVPLGGYVKFFGDADLASRPDDPLGEQAEALTPEERDVAFQYKSLGRRAAVVVAGPLANFAFAVLVLAGLYMTAGSPYPPPVIGEVTADGPAAAAGLAPGDRITAVDGAPVGRFIEVAAAVATSDGEPMTLQIARDGTERSVEIAAAPVMLETADGAQEQVWRIGIVADSGPYGPTRATLAAVSDSASLTWQTLVVVGRIFVGQEEVSGLGGPLRIAQMSGDFSQVGIAPFLWFMAILSINLGLINLFPVPMLDGGHLLFYAVEWVRGRPLGPRAQEYGFRIGLAMVLALVVLVTWNDLVQLEVFSFLRDIPS